MAGISAVVGACLISPAVAAPLGTSFTYQGRLDLGGSPVNGPADFEVSLWDEAGTGAPPAGGNQIGSTVTLSNVQVTNGLFTLELDFGAGALNGDARWLQLAVASPSGEPLTTLSPRVSLRSTPHALHSTNADSLDGKSANQFIQNTSTQQTSASFNIDGNGTLGGTLTANGILLGSGGLTMNNYFLRLRDSFDNNHGIRYMASIDGLEFRGFSGFRWSVGSGGTNERMQLDISGNLDIDGHYSIGGTRFAGRPGTLNTFVGESAGDVNTGQQNTLIGSRAGQANTSGLRNTFVGDAAGLSNTTASENTFIGALAGLQTTSASQNTFLGTGAGQNNTTGAGNTFVGFVAGNSNTTGSFNTAIGYNARIASNTLTNATAIGSNAVVTTSDTIVLGSRRDRVLIPGLGTARSKLCLSNDGEIGACVSSLRYKTNIAPFPGGLRLVSLLQPITFDWKDDGTKDLGLGAEDVAKVEPLLVTRNEDGQVEGVKYDRLSIILLNALKEQQTQIEDQQRTIEALKKLVCTDQPGADVCAE
jgi:hypothetical protein